MQLLLSISNAELSTPSVTNDCKATTCNADLDDNDRFGEIEAFLDNLNYILFISS